MTYGVLALSQLLIDHLIPQTLGGEEVPVSGPKIGATSIGVENGKGQGFLGKRNSDTFETFYLFKTNCFLGSLTHIEASE